MLALGLVTKYFCTQYERLKDDICILTVYHTGQVFRMLSVSILTAGKSGFSRDRRDSTPG